MCGNLSNKLLEYEFWNCWKKIARILRVLRSRQFGIWIHSWIIYHLVLKRNLFIENHQFCQSWLHFKMAYTELCSNISCCRCIPSFRWFPAPKTRSQKDSLFSTSLRRELCACWVYSEGTIIVANLWVDTFMQQVTWKLDSSVDISTEA